ncbi:MAG: hypothetical protein JWQ32_3306 [Marmoricola sp.]|nr:hypothetical protein [Marmoricola sp.]
MSAPRDAGLLAVARVRTVRESDSRVGLRQALAELEAAEHRVVELRRRMEVADAFGTGSAAEFLALRVSLSLLGEALVAAEQQCECTRTISDAALVRWQSDKARLGAIELLLERREAERCAERERADARELDDLATQRWLRAHTAGAA